MKTEYQYIRFVQAPPLSGRKTSVYSVLNIRSADQLGIIEWYGAQYVFHPFPRTVYSAGCLKDIEDFIGQLMAGRKTR